MTQSNSPKEEFILACDSRRVRNGGGRMAAGTQSTNTKQSKREVGKSTEDVNSKIQ